MMTAIKLVNDLSRVPPPVRAALNRKAAHFIDGAWISAATVLPVIDPSSTEPVAEIGRGGAGDIDDAVRAAQAALKSRAWLELGPLGRERLLHRLADLIDARRDVIAHLDTIENGMPLWLASDLNVAGSADVYRYFAGWPSKLVGETMPVNGPPGGGEYFAFTRREPVGVVGAITPWNVPFMMAAWKVAPALAAGCTVVLKPSESASLSAILLAELAMEAGFPRGVLNVVTGTGPEAGEALVTHPGVAKISFTGSTPTGRRIGELAGRHLKKVTLELGGKSPTILFADSNLDEAVVGAANSIFFNSGQICVAGSRLYVEDSVYDAVFERLRRHVSGLNVGAGLADGAFMGPLINARQRDRVAGYIADVRAAGREVFSAADLSDAAGYYVGPTLVSGADHDDPITQEEVFGPVLSLYRFSDVEAVLTAANGTAYGLAASVWSRDINRIMQVAARLECGKVAVNHAGFPYPGLPEGGVKGSGFGRDLGREAVEQCLQTKSVVIRTP
jgi:phenylacetaldehyde dehydrogenase